jgi:hypothetical protein
MKIFRVQYSVTIRPDCRFIDELLVPGETKKDAETTLLEQLATAKGVITVTTTTSRERILLPLVGSKVKILKTVETKIA